jgi:hypothetical protein
MTEGESAKWGKKWRPDLVPLRGANRLAILLDFCLFSELPSKLTPDIVERWRKGFDSPFHVFSDLLFGGFLSAWLHIDLP